MSISAATVRADWIARRRRTDGTPPRDGVPRRWTAAARVVAGALLVATLAAVATPRALAQSAVPEDEAKAAFIYNFAKFVEWPDEAFASGDAFIVGVVGDDPFAGVLDRVLRGKVVRDRPLAVRRIARAADVAGCHVIFVGEGRQLPDLLQALAARPVLTVGAREEFATQGGMIGFLVEDQRLRFEVNLDAAERANLRISSQLLKLATRVIRREG